MAKILITGSSDGIGLGAAKLLAAQGHTVYLHARNAERAKQAQSAVPNAAGVVVGDITTIAGSKAVSEEANRFGPFDTVVHNAAVGPSAADARTSDGLAATFAINSLAPYILTSLMERPKRLLYVTSSLHSGGDDSLRDVGWSGRRFAAFQAYSDTKLHNVMLANAVARHWPDVQSCSLDPGWVRTKLGGYGAPGSPDPPAKAIAAYAAGEKGIVGNGTGLYFNISCKRTPHQGAVDEKKQEQYLKICEEISGITFPAKQQ